MGWLVKAGLEKNAQLFCSDTCTPVEITFSLAKAEGHPMEEVAVMIHTFNIA